MVSFYVLGVERQAVNEIVGVVTANGRLLTSVISVELNSHRSAKVPTMSEVQSFHWHCRHTWQTAAINTGWCLLGCSLGDFGTLLVFQTYYPEVAPVVVLPLAIMNGLLTSIALETAILSRQMPWGIAIRTAFGMSLISMIGMEMSMNVTDWLLVGSLTLAWWSMAPSLLMGFLTPWPYNYWRLKKYGIACH